MAILLNYRDRDAALCKARDLGTLNHEGMEILLFPDFTQQVKEARWQFQQGKQQLRVLKLNSKIPYPMRPRVMVDEKALIFTDPQTLQHFIAKGEASGQQQNLLSTGTEETDAIMDDVE
ncbi:hypothetical protein NDU88_001806 [Pleurodeles waltl]|uniref:Uncharacterized protein n=1 Tax=Pleurodeles waltl TaxID=8319 RepID=A0AAV7SA09_PLEWA|nr:hypothetical protein NDU88_001806 [Pleurodeles waltl]